MMNQQIKLIECPRDAMQGWKNLIPTQSKINYLNALLSVGFDTLDFGSFVSPKAIPQMADTAEVLENLEPSDTQLLAIIANRRGAEDAAGYKTIKFLGFPFSISETFQQKNTNTSISTSFDTVKQIQEICINNDKTLVVYISMGFGNPYGDDYHEEIVHEWVSKMHETGIKIISIADTVGLATPARVSSVLAGIVPDFPDTEIGVHLHSSPENRLEKLDAALEAGCRRFDGAIKGIGGCPMSGNDLVGNMDTEVMYRHFLSRGYAVSIDESQLAKASALASNIFI